jgi:hypothetical protein
LFTWNSFRIVVNREFEREGESTEEGLGEPKVERPRKEGAGKSFIQCGAGAGGHVASYV